MTKYLRRSSTLPPYMAYPRFLLTMQISETELTHSVVPPLPAKAIRLCGGPWAAVVSLTGRALSEGDAAVATASGQCCKSSLTAQLEDAVQGSILQLSAKNFPPEAFALFGAAASGPISFAKRIKKREGDQSWQSIIWKQRSSAVAQAVLRWRLRRT